MRRTKMKRGTKGLDRGAPLQRGSKSLKRTPLERAASISKGSTIKRGKRLRVVGKRGAEIRRTLKKLRAVVERRDGAICKRCRHPRCLPLDLHHLLGRGRGGEHVASNLCLLGRPCHNAITFGNPDDRAQWVLSRKGAQHA